MPPRSRHARRSLVLLAAFAAGPASAQLSESDWRKAESPEPRVTGDVVRGPLPARDGQAGGFPAANVTLLSWVPLNQFPNDQRSGNDCWGYVSPSGREYALFGMQSGFSVLEVTDPTYPVQIGFIAGAGSLWRDIKVHGHYAYGVSEGGLGIQVIDLSQVDAGVVTHVKNKMQNGHATTHNIAINSDSGYLYLCGANVANGGLVAVSTADPEDPTIVGAWTGRYVHDAQIITYTSGPYAGREIAFCCTGSGGLDVIDVTDKSNMFRIGGHRYPGTHYCHQAWVSDDRQHLFVNDEMDEGTSFDVTTTHVLDISDPARPVEVGTFSSGSASTDHNLYVVGDLAFEANYMSGLRVFDVSDPLGATEIAYLDTSPAKDQPGYHGAWSNYPFFPSGTILISDIERGLFVLRLGDDGLDFAFPDGTPTLLRPGLPTQVRAEIAESGVVLDPDSVRLVVRTVDGPQETPMTLDGAGVFVAELPAGDCFEEVEYWITAKDAEGLAYVEPFNAPIDRGFVAHVGTANQDVLLDDFDDDRGWTVDNDGATAGGWARVEPQAGNAVEPASDADGSGFAFVTGATPGEWLEGGPILLTSPRLDLGGSPRATIRYSVWYGVDGNLVPQLRVELSSDGGVTWTTVGLHDREAAWRTFEFRVEDFLAPTADMRLRIKANNSAGSATVEVGVDGVSVHSLACAPCIADYNADGELNTIDFIAYLNDFTGATQFGDPDLNADGLVNSQDFLLFLNLFAAGCD